MRRSLWPMILVLVLGVVMTAGTSCSSGPQPAADVVVGADAPRDVPVVPDLPADLPGVDALADAPAADLTADVGPPPTDMTGLVVTPYDGGPVEVTEASFECLTNWDQVRVIRLTNIAGQLEQTLAVANDPRGKAYPVGSILQIIPGEAMVKREPGFSPESNDWEFFELAVSESGTTIRSRGTTKTECYSCHAPARDPWDFVCETEHGCKPLAISDQIINSLQNNDPRCQ